MITSWKDKKNICPNLKSAILYHQRSVLDCLNRYPNLFKKNVSCFKDLFIVDVHKLYLDDSEVQNFEKIIERRCINQMNEDVQHDAELASSNKTVKLISVQNNYPSGGQKVDKIEEKNLDKSTKEVKKKTETGLKSGLICLMKNFQNDDKSKYSYSSLNKAVKCTSANEKLKKDEKVVKTKIGSTVVKPKGEKLNVNKVSESVSRNSKRNTLPFYLNGYKIAKKPKKVEPNLNHVEEKIDKKREEKVHKKIEAKNETVIPSNKPPQLDIEEEIDVLAIDDIHLDFDLYETSFHDTEIEANNEMTNQANCEDEAVFCPLPKKPKEPSDGNVEKDAEKDTEEDVNAKALNNKSMVFETSSKLYPTLELAEELLDYESDSTEWEGNFKRLSKYESTDSLFKFKSQSQQDKCLQLIKNEKTISEPIKKTLKSADVSKDGGDNRLTIAKATPKIEVKSPITFKKSRFRERSNCLFDTERSPKKISTSTEFNEFKANLNQITSPGQMFEFFCNYSTSNSLIMKGCISDVQSILKKITFSLIEDDQFYFTKGITDKLIFQLKRFELDNNKFWSQIINTTNTKFDYLPKLNNIQTFFKAIYLHLIESNILINCHTARALFAILESQSSNVAETGQSDCAFMARPLNFSSIYTSNQFSISKSVPSPSLFSLSSHFDLNNASSSMRYYSQPDQTGKQNQSYLIPIITNRFQDNQNHPSILINNQQPFNQFSNMYKFDQDMRVSFTRQLSKTVSYSIIPHNIVPNVFYRKCKRVHTPEYALKSKFSIIPLSSAIQLPDPRLSLEGLRLSEHLQSNRTSYFSSLSYSNSSSLLSLNDPDFVGSQFSLNTSTLSPSRFELMPRNKIVKLQKKRTLDTNTGCTLPNNLKMFKHESSYENNVIDLRNIENLVIVKPLGSNLMTQSSSTSSVNSERRQIFLAGGLLN